MVVEIGVVVGLDSSDLFSGPSVDGLSDGGTNVAELSVGGGDGMISLRIKSVPLRVMSFSSSLIWGGIVCEEVGVD